MDSAELIDLLRSLSREQFVARMPRPFLLVAARSLEDEEAGFETQVQDPIESTGRRSSAARKWVILEIGKAPGNPYPDRISVGRARNCDVVLRDPSVSKLHAHFLPRRNDNSGAFDLVDLDSQNGTWINDVTVPSGAPSPVHSGDNLVFGSVGARLVDAGLLHDLLK
ncbi:MAG TPA: FHA domain-containing protein [Polyangia bacterium]